MNSQPRESAGKPEGGQWATKPRREPRVSLTGSAVYVGGTRINPNLLEKERLTKLARQNSLGALHVATTTDATKTRGIDAWWFEKAYTGEYQSDGKNVPKLPDSWGSVAPGLGSDGKRRIPRMRYRGSGFDVRMPAVARLRAFAKETGYDQFDVPMSAKVNGQDRSYWVRVTRTESGGFYGEVLGDDLDGKGTSETNLALGEVVTCLLTAQRVRTSMVSVEDLANFRMYRDRAVGAEPVRVRSSWINQLAYDKSLQIMHMETEGRTYGYVGVDETTFEAVLNAHQPGSQYNTTIKGRYTGVGSFQCEHCGRFAGVEAHICPRKKVINPRLNDQQSAWFQSMFATGSTVSALFGEDEKTASNVQVVDFGGEQLPFSNPQKQATVSVAALRTNPVGSGAKQFGATPGGVGVTPEQGYDQWWEHQSRLRQANHGVWGRPGFTKDLGGLLGRFASERNAPSAYVRRQQLNGDSQTILNGVNGHLMVGNVDGRVASQLFNELPPYSRNASVLGAPKVGDVLQAVAQNPEKLRFNGVLTGPAHPNEGLFVTSVDLVSNDTSLSGEQVLAQMAQMGVNHNGVNPSQVLWGRLSADPDVFGWRASWQRV